MIKGGYKIVNFNGAALSGTAVTLSGIYDQIVDDFDKPIMVSGVSLNGAIMDDAYAGVQEKTAQDLSKYVELTVYGGIITVTEDDEVTFVLSQTAADLAAGIGNWKAITFTGEYSGSLTGRYNNLLGIAVISYNSGSSGTTSVTLTLNVTAKALFYGALNKGGHLNVQSNTLTISNDQAYAVGEVIFNI